MIYNNNIVVTIAYRKFLPSSRLKILSLCRVIAPIHLPLPCISHAGELQRQLRITGFLLQKPKKDLEANVLFL